MWTQTRIALHSTTSRVLCKATLSTTMPTSAAPLVETPPSTPPTPAPVVVLPPYSWRTALDGGDLRSVTYLRDLKRADQLVATLTGYVGPLTFPSFLVAHEPLVLLGLTSSINHNSVLAEGRTLSPCFSSPISTGLSFCKCLP